MSLLEKDSLNCQTEKAMSLLETEAGLNEIKYLSKVGRAGLKKESLKDI